MKPKDSSEVSALSQALPEKVKVSTCACFDALNFHQPRGNEIVESPDLFANTTERSMGVNIIKGLNHDNWIANVITCWDMCEIGAAMTPRLAQKTNNETIGATTSANTCLSRMKQATCSSPNLGLQAWVKMLYFIAADLLRFCLGAKFGVTCREGIPRNCTSLSEQFARLQNNTPRYHVNIQKGRATQMNDSARWGT